MSELKNSQSSSAPTTWTPGSFLVVTVAFSKSQHLLAFTIDALLKRVGAAHVLFVTLTFPKHIRSTKAAQKKLNSLLNAVRERYGGYLWLLEPQASGRIHYHLLIPVDFDCHVGTDLDAWGEKFFPLENTYFRSTDPARCGMSTRDNYLRNSMNPALRAEDDWWQDAAKAHGFGRVQVAPIYGGAEAIRKYMTKQDWRYRPWPFKERKNIQFWRCSRNLRVGNVKFAWNSSGARQGRQRQATWAKGYGCESENDLRCLLGPQWGYRYHCEVVWPERRRPTAGAPEHQTTCPYPARRYNDPDFQPHPGLYEPSDSNVVGNLHSLVPPPPPSAQHPPAAPGSAGGRREPSAKRQGVPCETA